jgi:hypothetical protein
MFTSKQYRAKAAEYAARIERTDIPSEVREFREMERSFSQLADNEDWLADNFEKTVHALSEERAGSALAVDEKHALGEEQAGTLAAEEEHILRCLGAAVIMLWKVIPTTLQRELFDNAGAMGGVLDATELRGKIARFLHEHKDGEDVPASGG